MADMVLARAIIEVGAKGVQDTTTKVEGLEKKLVGVQKAYEKGTISLSRYLELSKSFRAQIDHLSGSLNAAIGAVNKHGSFQAAADRMAKEAKKAQEAAAAAGGGGNGAMGLLMLSQFIDDAQYGFRAVVNNIPLMTTALASAMGASTQLAMKLGGIAGIAAVAINTVITHWDKLFDRFGYGTETMKTLWKSFWGEARDISVDALDVIENKIKELKEKPIKTAVDLHDIDVLTEKAQELKEGRQAWEAMGKGRSPYEKESGEKIKQLFASTDAETIERIQTDLVTKRAAAKNAVSPAVLKEALTPAEEAEIRKNVAPGPGQLRGVSHAGFNTVAVADEAAKDAAVEAEKARRRKASSDAKAANQREAKNELSVMLGKAEQGNDVEQAKLVQALVDAGYRGMAAMVQSLSPEAAADSAAMVTQQQSDARQKAIRDMLNAEGKAGERDYLEQKAAARSAEATRFADQLQPRLSVDAVGDTREELEAKVKVALQKAGVAADDIGKMTSEVAAKLRMGVEERIRTKVLGGLTQEQAVRSVREEDKAARRALDRTPKSEIMSTESYLSKLLVAGFDRNSQEAKPVKLEDGQIDGVNERLDKILDATKENKPGVARFSDGGGGDAARENGPMM